MRAHLVQMDIAWQDRAANCAKVESLVSHAAPDSGDLVVLPEMFDSGFSLDIEKIADAEGRTLSFLKELGARLGVTIHGSRTTIGPDQKARNCATIIGPGGELLLEFHKIHPFSFGREQERFTGGDVVSTYRWQGPSDGLLVCPAVCYDLRFPELFRLGLSKGAEAFVLGANWPVTRHEHWRALLIARAIENQAFVLGVNRVGKDPNLAYTGGTIAVDPRGHVLAEAADGQRVVSVEIAPERVREWRKSFPAWRDAKQMR